MDVAVGMAVVLGLVGAGYGFRALIGRETHKIGAFVKSEAAKGETSALAIVARFKKAL